MTRASRNRNIFLLAAALFAAGGASAQTVSLQLTNGDRISGKIISETAERVVLSNVWSREFVIPLADIARRITNAVPTNAIAAAAATNAAVAAGKTTNAPAQTNNVAVAKAVAATNNLFTSPWLKNWHGDIQAGMDLTFSERNRQIYNGKAKVIYARGPFKSVFDYDMTYGRSEVEQTISTTNYGPVKRESTRTDANRMNGSVKADYDLTKKWYVYNLAGMGYDELRKIDLRYEIGPGIGYHLIQWKNFFANTEAGATYQKEERSDDTEVSTFYCRFAENATWKITPRLSWDEKFEYLPRIEDPAQYRVRFETNLRYAMLQNVFFNLSLIDTYDSRPANGVTENDLQIRSSVGVKF